jgi:hypothetical protein
MTQENTELKQLDERIARLDQLIAERDDASRGLGLRLALGLARETVKGLPLGTETADMVLAWVERFGVEVVDEAVVQSRVLLTQPQKMTEELARRIHIVPTTDDDLSGAEDLHV